MTMTQNEQTESTVPEPAVEPPHWTRRRVLRTVGLGSATVLVAGTGLLS